MMEITVFDFWISFKERNRSGIVDPTDAFALHGLTRVLLAIIELHFNLIEKRLFIGNERKFPFSISRFRLESNKIGKNVQILAYGHSGSRNRVAIGLDNDQLVFVSVVTAIEIFRGVVQCLIRRVKYTFFLVMDGQSVKDKLSACRLVGLSLAFQLDDVGFQFFGIVGRVVNQGHLVGIDQLIIASAKSLGNLDIIGIGKDIDDAINDGDVLVVGIQFDVGAAREESRHATDQQQKGYHLFHVIVFLILNRKFRR